MSCLAVYCRNCDPIGLYHLHFHRRSRTISLRRVGAKSTSAWDVKRNKTMTRSRRDRPEFELPTIVHSDEYTLLLSPHCPLSLTQTHLNCFNQSNLFDRHTRTNRFIGPENCIVCVIDRLKHNQPTYCKMHLFKALWPSG